MSLRFRASPWVSYEPNLSTSSSSSPLTQLRPNLSPQFPTTISTSVISPISSIATTIMSTTNTSRVDSDSMDMDAPQISILRDEETPPPQPKSVSSSRRNKSSAAPKHTSWSRPPIRKESVSEDELNEEPEEEEDQLIDDDEDEPIPPAALQNPAGRASAATIGAGGVAEGGASVGSVSTAGAPGADPSGTDTPPGKPSWLVLDWSEQEGKDSTGRPQKRKAPVKRKPRKSEKKSAGEDSASNTRKKEKEKEKDKGKEKDKDKDKDKEKGGKVATAPSQGSLPSPSSDLSHVDFHESIKELQDNKLPLGDNEKNTTTETSVLDAPASLVVPEASKTSVSKRKTKATAKSKLSTVLQLADDVSSQALSGTAASSPVTNGIDATEQIQADRPLLVADSDLLKTGDGMLSLPPSDGASAQPLEEAINLESVPHPQYPLPTKPFPVQPPPKIPTGFAPLVPLDKSKKKVRHWRTAQREIRGIAGGRWFARTWVGNKNSEFASHQTALNAAAGQKDKDDKLPGVSLPKLLPMSASASVGKSRSKGSKAAAGTTSGQASTGASAAPSRDGSAIPPDAPLTLSQLNSTTRPPTKMREVLQLAPSGPDEVIQDVEMVTVPPA